MKLTRTGGFTLGVFAILVVGLLCVAKFRDTRQDSRYDARRAAGGDATAGSSPDGQHMPEPAPLEDAVVGVGLTDDTFEALLATRPEAAAAEVAALPEATELRDMRLARLMEVWAETTPREAANWTRNLPSGGFRDEAMQELSAAWCKNDPMAAAEWARRELTSGQLIPSAALLSVWGRRDADAAVDWLSGLGDSEALDTATLAKLSGALAYAWATSDPLAAAEWVAAQEEPGIRGTAVVNLAAGWAETDPDALARWLGVNVPPDAGEAEAAYVTLVSHWADHRPDAAGRWATSLPAGELRDTTLATFTSNLAMSEPASALRWSQSIVDDALRLEAAIDIYETWLDDDLAAAREAIVTAVPDLSERSHQQALYNLLHEKDPVFRDELYNLILPEGTPVQQEHPAATPTANESSAARPQPPEPQIRRALPVTEDDVDVKAMAR